MSEIITDNCDTLYQQIDYLNITNVYAIVTDAKKHPLLAPDQTSLFGTYCIMVDRGDERQLLLDYLSKTYGFECKIVRLLAIESVRVAQSEDHYFVDFDNFPDASKPEVIAYGITNHYRIYYHVTVNSHKLATHYHYPLSRLVNHPVYMDHIRLFNELYCTGRIKLFLDIDNTLLQSIQYTENKSDKSGKSGIISNDNFLLHSDVYPPDHVVKLSDSHQRYVWLRPHFHYFMEKVSQLCDVYFWTAGTICCQKPIMETLGYGHFPIYCRRYCDEIEGSYPVKSFKNLLKMTGNQFPMNRCLLVDDLYANCCINQNNSYHISAWHVTHVTSLQQLQVVKEDHGLLNLLSFLTRLVDHIAHES